MTDIEREHNLFLFSFMKDNVQWRTEIKGSHCTYHNPLNSSIYGLQFHRDHRWLDAVEDKMRERILDSGFEYVSRIIKGNEQYTGRSYYCMIIETKHYREIKYKYLAHVHSYNYMNGRRLLLVSAIKDLISQWN